MLTNRFNLPAAASKTIVIDYDTKKCGKLNNYRCEEIMKQLLNVDESVLQKRLLIFDFADSNHDGYIDLSELPTLLYFINSKINTRSTTTSSLSVHYMVKHFNMNGNAKFNFLDVNKYMNSINKNFSP